MMLKEKLLEQLKDGSVPQNIIKAFANVKRENFIPEEFALNAYDDIPIPLDGAESSISQPTTIALMLQLLDVQENSKVLEIGSGCGYVLALLSELAQKGEIFGIEIKTNIAAISKKNLADKEKVHIFNLDGSTGLPDQAPFDKIIISASAPDIGTVYQILDQLNDPGILVAPVKDSLIQIKKKDKKIEKVEFPGFAFVPLIKKDFP